MTTTFLGYTSAQLEARGATWTAKEIAQQPAVWMDVASLIATERERIEKFLAPLLSNPALRIVLTGAGTSSFLGACLAPAVSAQLNRRVESIATTDIVSGPECHLHDSVPTLLVSFARSGNSPESVATVDLAERMITNVHHFIITCNPEGSLAQRAAGLRHAQVLTLPDATNDRGFAMTSSFSSMLIAAGLLFGVIREKQIPSLSHVAERLLSRSSELALRLVGREFQRVIYLGSNELRGLASEAALKLLELTDGQTIVLSESTLGFRHGPKTIVNNRSLIVLMVSNDPYARAYDNDLLTELRRDARAAEILALSGRELAGQECFNIDGVSDANDLELALLYVLIAQTFALAQSLALGLTPDQPNAAGVVNRVVQGVIIHPWAGK